jgi:putative SOS response-associated peptidase YedK
MCGRFYLSASPDDIRSAFGLQKKPNHTPRYNIAPTQTVPVVVETLQGREAVLARWGLVPHWAKEVSIGSRLINARAETVEEKSVFRDAFAERRCIVPADGFFEWRRDGATKQPYRIALKEGGLIGFAGLWETWQDELNKPITTFTIITTEANALVRPIHDRMPVILKQSDYTRWLDPLTLPKEAHKLLQPYPGSDMAAVPISTRVNSVRHDDKAVLEPVTL